MSDVTAVAWISLAAAAGMPKVMEMSHKREIAKLRQRIEREGPREQEGGYLGTGDRTLLRYLKARKWSVDQAYSMYADTIRWRKDRDIDQYRRSAVGPFGAAGWNFARNHGYRAKGGVEAHPETRLAGEDAKEGCFRAFCAAGCFGVDKEGRPLYIERTGAMAPVLDTTVKFVTRDELTYRHIRQQEIMLARLEELQEHAGRPIDGQFVILDVVGLSYLPSADGVAVFKEVSRLDTAHYPETLGKQFIVNAPTLFKIVWAAVKGFIDPNTAQKIEILGKKDVRKLLNYIDASQLPCEYGGTLEVELEPVRYTAEKARRKVSAAECVELGNEVAHTLRRHAVNLKKRFVASTQGDTEAVQRLEDDDTSLGSEFMAPQSPRSPGHPPLHLASADLYSGGCRLWVLVFLWATLACVGGGAAGYFEGDWLAFRICLATGASWVLSALVMAKISQDIRSVSYSVQHGADRIGAVIEQYSWEGAGPVGQPACSRPLRKLQRCAVQAGAHASRSGLSSPRAAPAAPEPMAPPLLTAPLPPVPEHTRPIEPCSPEVETCVSGASPRSGSV